MNGTNGDAKSSRVANGNGTLKNEQVREAGALYNFVHYTGTPLFMLVIIPNISLALWFSSVTCGGSYLEFARRLLASPSATLNAMWAIAFEQMTSTVWIVLLGYCAFALLLMVLVPGQRYVGPVTEKGNVPVYKDNGFRCYVISLAVFAVLTYVLKLNGMSPTYVYDNFAGFVLACNILGHVLCLFLLYKGLTNPTTTDSGSSGNFLFDYYWGTDLYPKVCGIDVKVFTNCRFGMTVWPLLVLIFSLKSYELHGFVDGVWVSSALQLIYITKFFVWEAGYYASIDIIVDRAGYMICWGCLCYIPGMYASVSLYLVRNSVSLGPELSAAIFTGGTVAIALNYWADYQRQVVREANGETTIWGKKPKLIFARYRLENGAERSSILLVSGFWAIARHFNYVPEIALAFFWSLPALFENLLPYSYVIYLTMLLVHRSFRDDQKCLKKYGRYWEQYCAAVPYKILPGII